MKLYQPLCLLALSLVVSAIPANAEQTQVPDQRTAIDFTIGGVGIDSTLEDLHDRLPTAAEGHSPGAIPMRDDHLVVINNGALQVPIAYFRFLNETVISIEIHYNASSLLEITFDKPMIDQLVALFGDYEKTWRHDNLDGGVNTYSWTSDTRFVSLAMHDDGSAKLYIRGSNHPKLYPPKTPKTSILGIDPLVPVGSGG